VIGDIISILGVPERLRMYQFHDFSNVLIGGVAQGGKSTFTKDLLLAASKLFPTPPSLIIYCYKSWEPLLNELEEKLPNLKLTSTLPNEEEIKEIVTNQAHTIIVFDDICTEIGHNPFFEALYTRLSHHLKITPILITQNLNSGGRFMGSVLKNTHYTILLRSPRFFSTIKAIGGQLSDYCALKEIYQEICQTMYNYLVIDLHPNTPSKLKYRTNILNKTSEPTIVYVSKTT